MYQGIENDHLQGNFYIFDLTNKQQFRSSNNMNKCLSLRSQSNIQQPVFLENRALENMVSKNTKKDQNIKTITENIKKLMKRKLNTTLKNSISFSSLYLTSKRTQNKEKKKKNQNQKKYIILDFQPTIFENNQQNKYILNKQQQNLRPQTVDNRKTQKYNNIFKPKLTYHDRIKMKIINQVQGINNYEGFTRIKKVQTNILKCTQDIQKKLKFKQKTQFRPLGYKVTKNGLTIKRSNPDLKCNSVVLSNKNTSQKQKLFFKVLYEQLQQQQEKFSNIFRKMKKMKSGLKQKKYNLNQIVLTQSSKQKQVNLISQKHNDNANQLELLKWQQKCLSIASICSCNLNKNKNIKRQVSSVSKFLNKMNKVYQNSKQILNNITLQVQK